MSATATAILSCFQEYARNPMQQAARLRSLMEEYPPEFLDCVGQDASGDLGSRGFRFALLLLRNSGLLIPYLSDPKKSSHGQALRLMKFMTTIETDFADFLLRMVESNDPTVSDDQQKLRLLDLISDSGCHLSGWRLVAKLLSSDDHRIKTRCVSLMTRNRLDPKILDSLYEQGDARTRADLVEVLSGNRHPQLEIIIDRALTDGNNRVAANAYLAAYQADDERSLAWLAAMIGDEKPENFRISAAWAIGQTRDPRLAGSLLEARRSADSKLRAAALKALTKLERIERCPVSPEIQISRVFETPCSSTPQEDVQRTLYLAVKGPEASPAFSPKPIDFFLFRDKIPIVKYVVEKPVPERLQIRIACPSAALRGLIKYLNEGLAGVAAGSSVIQSAIQSIAVYGGGVADQKSVAGLTPTLPCLWVNSPDEAARTLLEPWAGDVDRHSILLCDSKLSMNLNSRDFEEECTRLASMLYVAPFDPDCGKEFWESYTAAIEHAWRVRLQGPLSQLSLRIRSRVGTETSFSEKVVWQ